MRAHSSLRALAAWTPALVVLALVLWPARPAAHDIPADVLVQSFLKPEGTTLHLLVRVPLGAMRDINFPTHGQGLLNIPPPDTLLRDAAQTWLASAIEIYEGDRRLGPPRIAAAQASLMSDRSFESYAQALAHMTGPGLPPGTEVAWNQSLLDVAFEYAIASDQSRFSIRPALARLGSRVVTVLRFEPPGGSTRAFQYTGDPGLVRLDPRWHQAALQFVRLGFLHILDGTDHLLFLFCLVIPFRRLRALVLIVTAFTIAHSITLIASAVDLAPGALWFPPLIETLIAMSIVYMALENIVIAGPRGDAPPARAAVRRRWIITFAFGLIHGFGFSFALRETLQFAGAHLLTSLLSFNVGIELGQILVLLILLPVLHVLFRYVVAERMGTIILSALVVHTAWHWTTERFEHLRQFNGPALDAAFLAGALRWLMAAVAVAGAIWLVRRRGRIVERRGEEGL